MKFGFKQPSVFLGKKFENVESKCPWTKVKVFGFLVPQKNVFKGFYHI